MAGESGLSRWSRPASSSGSSVSTSRGSRRISRRPSRSAWRLARSAWGQRLRDRGRDGGAGYAFERDPGSPRSSPSRTVANVRSRRVMERIGMTHDPADDFDHPRGRRRACPAARPLPAGAWLAFSRERHDAVRDDRGGDRGDPRGPDGRRRRRSRPRERGRPDDRGAVRDAGGDQLHGDARARAHLPLPHRGACRRARPAPDDRPQRGAARHRVHRQRRGARGRDHRHLGGRPQPHDPGGDPSGFDAARPRAARSRVPAAREAGRRARAHRPDRGGGRPRAPRRPHSGGRRLRDHERRRDDGPGRRPRPVLRAARPEDDHGRRSRRVPPPPREARRARRRRSGSRPSSASSRRSRSARS